MTIPKIRKGNDFVFILPIERGGEPEDLTAITDGILTASVFSEKKIVPFTVVDTNKLRIEFTPLICSITGIYNLKFEYTLTDLSFSDSERECTVDVDAFEIVAKSSQASLSEEFTITADMAIAFQGKNAYEIWLETYEGTQEDYTAFLRQPAVEAAASANEAAELANTKAGEANTAAELANTARLNIQSDLAAKIGSDIYSEAEYNEV